jgi:hypothetical protein
MSIDCRLTRWVSLVEEELLTVLVFSGVRLLDLQFYVYVL